MISSRATASEIKAKPASVVLDLPASGLRATIAGNWLLAGNTNVPAIAGNVLIWLRLQAQHVIMKLNKWL